MPCVSKADLDYMLGLKYYSSCSEGIGGKLREHIEDFVVKEISRDGIICEPYCNYSSVGNVVWFVLEKRGIDTITALRLIARVLRIRLNDLGIAGLKDTRAITYQFVSIRNVSIEEVQGIKSIGNKVFIHCPFCRPFELRPGILYGNKFEITIREVKNNGVRSKIRRILDEIYQYGGIPNYYGYQRFGTIRPNTHIIGKLILHGRYENAVKELLLHIYPGESPKAIEARKYLGETWDIKGALKIFPLNLHHERTILYHLLKHPDDYLGAIKKLPLSIKKLFVGAYQAYLFNLILSKRIESDLPIHLCTVGDRVAIYKNPRDVEPCGILKVNETNINKINELIERGVASLVLPVYGYAIEPAHGIQGEIELEILREEEVNVEMFKIKDIPEISSRGAFRTASFLPENLSIKYFSEGIKFVFSLRKGKYATVLLREFIKPVDILQSGF